MQYNDPQHRILKYLYKAENHPSLAHLKCSKAGTRDHKRLEVIATKKRIPEHVSEVIQRDDFLVDLSRVKALFAERQTITETDFDTALSALEQNGYVLSGEITSTGRTKIEELETAQDDLRNRILL